MSYDIPPLDTIGRGLYTQEEDRILRLANEIKMRRLNESQNKPPVAFIGRGGVGGAIL